MIEIAVKATTANLGPGFDCMGLALDIENKVIIKESNEEFKDKKNLIYFSIKKVFEIVGKSIPKLQIDQNIQIPISRGLGSSAACIAAGCIAGNILSGANLSIDELINIGTSIEGHPDNIVPAFLGGYTISSLEEDKVVYFRQEAFTGFKYGVMIPDFTLSTTVARNALPDSIQYKDAVFNVAKSALLSAAMITGDGKLLKFACEDKIHQPYRKHLIPGFDEITSMANSMGALGTFLSGAGPTIVSILDSEDDIFEIEMNKFLLGLKGGWSLKVIKASNIGVQAKSI
ncbi:MAG: homoserine kinase [Firmicutes bacterium]|nr:homoserine kinase [Bacillota bacterium]